MRRAALAAILVSGPVGAMPPEGVYDGFDCAAPVSDQRVTLQGDRIAFYESSCRLSDPRSGEDWENATLYWADCRGEGQDWRERTLLMTRMGDDLIVIGDGWAERYSHCPGLEPEAE